MRLLINIDVDDLEKAIAFGILPHLAATVAGRAALMHTNALAFQVRRIAGVLYLFYVAYATWRGFIAHAFRTLVIESPRVQTWLRYRSSAAFAGLGARLAVTDH